MATLSYCLPEILDIIVEHLVIAIGIQKAVLLRTVSRAFDAAIMHAICTRQVIDAEAEDSLMLYRMERNFRIGILLQKSRLATVNSQSYLQAIARVNRALDRLVDNIDPEQARIRHEAVAKSILFADNYRSVTDENELQNLLCAAALTGSIPLVKKVQLLALPTSAEAILNRRTPYFPIALTLAAGEGHLDLVNYLLDQGARQDSEAMYWRGEDSPDLSSWNFVCEFEHLEALDTRRFSALRAAVLYGHTDIVHLLLQPEHRIPTNDVEYLRAIMSAVKAGRLDFIQLLFEAIGKQQSDFEGLGNYMMWQAIRGDQAEVVQMLLVNGVDLHYNPNHSWSGYGALHLAASSGRAKLVALLLEQGADPNGEPPRSNRLPIEGAAERGQKDTMDLLLDRGASATMAFYAAAAGGQSWLMKDLLTRFPAELTQLIVLQTCLGHAMHSCNLTAMTLLVNAGLSLNDCYKRDGDRWVSPVDLAISLNERSWSRAVGPWVIDHLVSLGARPTKIRNTSEEAEKRAFRRCRDVTLSERTWDWVGRY